MALIIRQADVSASTFQNIFRNKEGVLMELTQTMFEKQFSMASGVMGEAMPPVYLYAAETAIQLTLAELNENLREIYVEAYTRSSVAEYICENTAKVLYQVFGSYLPECTPEEFYEMDIGTSGLMRGYMARKCDEAFFAPIAGSDLTLFLRGRGSERYLVAKEGMFFLAALTLVTLPVKAEKDLKQSIGGDKD